MDEPEVSEPTPTPDAAAAWLLRANAWATAAFAGLSLLTWAVAETLDLAYAILCGAVFVIGAGLFMLGFWNGAQRSRTEAVTLTGLLGVSTGNVAASDRRRLWLANTVQVVIAVVFASLRPFSQQAFAGKSAFNFSKRVEDRQTVLGNGHVFIGFCQIQVGSQSAALKDGLQNVTDQIPDAEIAAQ